MDLAQTNCVVQYTSNGQSYVYAVPFCDITTFEGKMIIPWTISASATEFSGNIKYFLRFYLIEGAFSADTPSEMEDAHFTYSLSTLPATSVILKTLSQQDFISEDEALGMKLGLPERYFELIDIFAKMVNDSTSYWNDVVISKNEEEENS